MKRKYFRFIKNGIKILYVPRDKMYIKETYSGVLKGICKLSAYFNMKKKLPPVEIILAEDRKDYDSILCSVFGLKIDKTPSTRIAQTKGKHLLLLSPQAYEYDSIYTYKHDEYLRLIIHEVTHMTVRIISGGEDSVPRWFEEGLAVYLSKQWLYEDEFRKSVFQGVSRGEIPSLKSIFSNRVYYYYWAWTVVKYIEKIYGKKMILEIIKRSNQQDIFEIIGEKNHLVEQRWKDDLNKYIVLRSGVS